MAGVFFRFSQHGAPPTPSIAVTSDQSAEGDVRRTSSHTLRRPTSERTMTPAMTSRTEG